MKLHEMGPSPKKPLGIKENYIAVPKGLKYTPYQLAGIEFLEYRNGKGIIADEMGVGKTPQAIGYLNLHRSQFMNILIVCPAFLKINWERELRKWLVDDGLTLSLHAHKGKIYIIKSKKEPESIKGGIVITSYGMLSKRTEELNAIKWDAVIIDEAHYIKNPEAKRSKALRRIVEKSGSAICLTGTPLLNRPIELYNILNLVAGEENSWFRDIEGYITWFCDPEETPWGIRATGASNLELLREEMVGIMIRRTKEEVMTDLPPKIRSTVILSLDEYFSERDAKRIFKEIRRKKHI